VYRLTLDAARPIAKGLSFDVTIDSSVQRGSMDARLAHQVIPRHTAMVKLVATPATRPR
jgi:hypothetical protein